MEMNYEELDFNDELYQKNIEENNFEGSETDEIGDDENANNES